MRNLTNEYRDAQVLDLGSAGDRGPYLVTQTGVAPNDAIPRTHLFVLRPDGRWADFNAYACQQNPEAMDELVFSSMTKIIETFGRLSRQVQVADLPIDEAGLKAWIARQESANPLDTARAWALAYKERRRKK